MKRERGFAVATTPEIVHRIDHVLDRSRVAVVIPTYNAAKLWAGLRDGLKAQGLPSGQILIVDSSSDDGTRELALAEGYKVFQIDQLDFNHGGTRKLALDLVPWASIVVYLTQDAVLATPDALDQLLAAFNDPDVAAAYGRQLPRADAGPIEAHARLFNYPATSDIRSFESRETLGIKAAFMSNSFAAYRTNELREVGGFPSEVIMAEDTIAAGKLLLAGWKTAYVAEAQVYHSHPFTIGEEFRRYFDIGVCHRQESWLPQRFGKPGPEGGRYIRSEFLYVIRRSPHLLPVVLLRTILKAFGYELGLHGAWAGRGWSKKLSYHKTFWDSTGKPAKDLAAVRVQPKVSSSQHSPLR
jgi:rhamnosyltransferase